MGIVDDILNDSADMQDVIRHNIRVMEEFIPRAISNRHPAEGCNKQYCPHGNPRFIQQLKDHLEFLKSELEDNPQ